MNGEISQHGTGGMSKTASRSAQAATTNFFLITVIKKNGDIREFLHEGRAGGSYSKSIHCGGNFVIIKNEWGDETIIPSDDIEEIKTESHMGRW